MEEGAELRTTQEILRHSDPRLTAMIYIHAPRLPVQKAMDKLPNVVAGLPHLLPYGNNSSSNSMKQDETVLPVAGEGDGDNLRQVETEKGMATPLGFEPRQREPKSLVLPLHYGVSGKPLQGGIL